MYQSRSSVSRAVRGALVFALLLARVASADPILEYKFNDSGTTTASTGSAPGETLQLVYGYDSTTKAPAPFDTTTPGFAPYDFHGAAGSGVSGLASDRSLDDTWSVGGAGGWAINTSSTVLQNLKSFTISGWYDRQPVADGGNAPGGGASIFFTPVTQSLPGGLLDTTPNGFGLRWNNAGSFRYDLSGNTLTTDTSANTWTAEGKWVFFAETYDSTTKTLDLYRGFRNSSEAGTQPAGVTLVASMSVASGTGDLRFNSTLSVGYSLMNRGPGGAVTGGTYAFPGFDRAFDAMVDNIRIDGSYTDGSGALSLTALEAYRFKDVFPVTGDANGDGVVNGLDIALIASGWLHTGVGSSGDTNDDGVVNGLDIALVASNWLHANGSNSAAAVPEPGGVLLLSIGLLCAGGYRLRRSLRSYST